jgi:uncharacterized protein YkwD
MYRKDAIAGAIVLLFVVVFSTSAAAATQRGTTDGCAGAAVLSAGENGLGEAVEAILCLVNQERSQRGLPAVRLSQQLSQSATAQSQDMVQQQFFSHDSPRGLSFRQRIARSGYGRSRSYLGETLAWGSEDQAAPVGLIRALMASPLHKRVILDARFRDVGVGLVGAAPEPNVAGQSMTLTLDFGRRWR